MSLQALMALLGHVSPQMTLRYAALSNGTVRGAYDAAMTKLQQRQPLPLVVSGHPVVPDKIAWLDSEMIKTRVAHGSCSRHLAAEACPYANICENCDNCQTSSQSSPSCKTSLPTPKPSTTTPSSGAGTARSPAKRGSSPASSATSTD